MDLRTARSSDIERLARIWHDGWQDAHASTLPAQLRRLRTLEHFTEQLCGARERTLVADAAGEAVGFCILKGDELYQFYVSARARGAGVAASLLAEAEARMASAGVTRAWLSCAIGNLRAARFYEKCSWQRTGAVAIDAETAEGPFPLQVWRYEKTLR